MKCGKNCIWTRKKNPRDNSAQEWLISFNTKKLIKKLRHQLRIYLSYWRKIMDNTNTNFYMFLNKLIRINCRVISEILSRDTQVAQSVKHLTSAKAMNLRSWNQVPHQAHCSAGNLLPTLSLPPASTLSLKLNK